MSIAMAGFILNDTIMKYAASELGLFQGMFVRGVFAALFIGIFAWHRGAFRHLPQGRDRLLVALRVLCELCATVFFLIALYKLPIANITAILQSVPLAVTLAAALYLHEPVGIKRGMATIFGFMGVLLIIRPGTSGFNAYALLALLPVFIITCREMITRQLAAQTNSLFITAMTALAIAVAGGIGNLAFEVWHPVDVRTVAMLAIAAIFLLIGYYFSIVAMRVGSIIFIAPFRYSMMLWAVMLGYIVFGDIPDFLTLIGIAMIVTTGVFTFYREQKLQKTTASGMTTAK